VTVWLLVCVGGAAGAVARWLLDGAVQRRWPSRFPTGVLLVNIVGSFVLGAVLATTLGWEQRTEWTALLGTGFCGGFTTFSTFAYETVALAEDGAAPMAVVNALASVGLALGAAFAGWWAFGGPL
jgi:fluoride exporter